MLLFNDVISVRRAVNLRIIGGKDECLQDFGGTAGREKATRKLISTFNCHIQG
jgi:hypothetical protein